LVKQKSGGGKDGMAKDGRLGIIAHRNYQAADRFVGWKPTSQQTNQQTYK
jgi:hypothetical protein